LAAAGDDVPAADNEGGKTCRISGSDKGRYPTHSESSMKGTAINAAPRLFSYFGKQFVAVRPELLRDHRSSILQLICLQELPNH
jgi:hypothetical protein